MMHYLWVPILQLNLSEIAHKHYFKKEKIVNINEKYIYIQINEWEKNKVIRKEEIMSNKKILKNCKFLQRHIFSKYAFMLFKLQYNEADIKLIVRKCVNKGKTQIGWIILIVIIIKNRLIM